MQGEFITVADVMQRSIYYVSGLASIRDAIRLMQDHQVTALVIERRHDGDEFGFISVEKIASHVVAVNKSLDRTSVYEVMDKPTLSLNPHMAVKYAIRLLAQLDHRRALVVDQTGAQGLVTLRDLVLCFAKDGLDPQATAGGRAHE